MAEPQQSGLSRKWLYKSMILLLIVATPHLLDGVLKKMVIIFKASGQIKMSHKNEEISYIF